MTRTITVNNGSLDSLLLSAASQASFATDALIRAVVEGAPLEDDVIEKLCDAAKMAIEAVAINRLNAGHPGELDDDCGQILAALTRYLTGWAG